MSSLVANFVIEHDDGSQSQDSGTFDRLSHAIARAGEWFEADETITRVDVREVITGRESPIRASVIA